MNDGSDSAAYYLRTEMHKSYISVHSQIIFYYVMINEFIIFKDLKMFFSVMDYLLVKLYVDLLTIKHIFVNVLFVHVYVIFFCYWKLWIMELIVIIFRAYLIISFLHSRDEYSVRQNQGHTQVQQQCILIILHLSKVYPIMFRKTWLIFVKNVKIVCIHLV